MELFSIVKFRACSILLLQWRHIFLVFLKDKSLSVSVVYFSKFFPKAFMIAAFIALLGLMSAPQVQAQFLPGSSAAKNDSPKALDALLEEARKDGSTVIVVRPGDSEAVETAGADNMRAEMFLRARAKIAEIAQSVGSFWPALKTTLEAASPDGSYFWILRGIGTAVLGTLLAAFITSRIFRWADGQFDWMKPNEPNTDADKVQYLLVRTALAVVLVSIAVITSLIVAVLLDSGHEPTRRLIFELIAANAVYRFLRHGVSWNLFAGAMPKHRLVNLTDDEAISIHRRFHISVLIAVVYTGISRFFIFTGGDQTEAGVAGAMTPEHAKVLELGIALVVTLLVIFLTIRSWRAWQHIAAPREPGSFFKLRTALAKLLPVAWLLYAIFAMGNFAFKLALGLPAPGLVIAAPFIVFYLAILAYGVALLVIQAFYNRREARFNELAAAERAKHKENLTVIDEDSGEEMIVSQTSAPVFEFQPAFRSFFENSALVIIFAIALGELANIWGVDVRHDDNFWSAGLDIGLAAILCWLAYRSVSIFIDRRLIEEGGVPAGEEELGGEGGGAGASRMATLLPIMRYVMVITLFSVAGMVILSRMGFDIAPIFAGAGVVGIAVGFGAQTLIRDVFSGAFFLMDDAFRKGEYVDIEGVKGVVEKISIRSFQLRHHLGALHTLPFGEIKQLTNYSRDWVMMKLPLRVTYDTDVDKVRKLVKKLGQELLKHPQVGHTFMQPLKSQGVYKMEDSAMIIRVKFMTKPGEQFVTRKVVYESIQDLFAREGIHFAHKEVTVRLADQSTDELTEQEKKAVTAAARSVLDAEEAEKAAAGGKPKDGGR
jgi:small-conductance mechanosensitive channel